MSQKKKMEIRNEVPRYNLIAPQIQKTPPNYKNSSTYVLPLFVTECQRPIRIHHQKEVAEVTVSNAPDPLAEHEAHQACPPKSNHESLEWL